MRRLRNIFLVHGMPAEFTGERCLWIAVLATYIDDCERLRQEYEELKISLRKTRKRSPYLEGRVVTQEGNLDRVIFKEASLYYYQAQSDYTKILCTFVGVDHGYFVKNVDCLLKQIEGWKPTYDLEARGK